MSITFGFAITGDAWASNASKMTRESIDIAIPQGSFVDFPILGERWV